MNKELWISTALEEGFDNFEIYQRVSEEKTFNYFRGELESFVTSHVLGTSFRGLYNGKMAMNATEDPGDDQMGRVLSLMKEQSSVITSEEVAEIFPPMETEEVHSERHYVSPKSQDVLNVLSKIEKKCLGYDPRVIQVTDVSYSETYTRREITNSRGMDVKDEERVHVLVVGIAVQDGNEIQNDYKVEAVEDLTKLDIDQFVKEACDEVLLKLRSVSLVSGFKPVIIRKEAMTSLFSALSGLYSGELIGKGISPLKDKLGEMIFSKKITVIDDPKDLEALSQANYDDEGHPTMKKTVVNEGVFETILHDSKSAKRMNAQSTGNGFKGSYAGAVSVSPRNMYIVKGEKSLNELEEMMGEGLVITDFQGLHAGIDFVTTNFSLQCSGYYVKEGKRLQSVSLITAAGNFLDLMKKVREVGNDLEWKYHSVVSPSILFEGIAVSGE